MRLTFLGGAKTVTGSSFFLEINHRKVLIDCGMFQGSKAVRALNHRGFAFDPATLDCVFLTHAHIDHSGLLPKLCKEGFRGPIYATKVTTELCRLMLPDSAHIQESDAEIANRKGLRAGKKPVEPLYTQEDAAKCLEQFAIIAYNREVELSAQLKIRFYDAGHILGSSIVEVYVTENGETTKLLFSGDLGQSNQPIIKDPTPVRGADYIVIESTYGNRKHEHFYKEEKLMQIVNETAARGGNIIIPSFAVGRTQTILYYLYKLWRDGKIPAIPIIIDSPLAISATDVFMHNTENFDEEALAVIHSKDSPAHMPQLRFTRTAEESKALNNLDQPKIILSASGMCDAGRILHHLKHNLWSPDSSVVFVGYQAEGSLGRRLIEGVKRVKIIGEQIIVRAHIHNLEGFSAHADQDELLAWLSYFSDPKPKNIFIVHGEPAGAEPFAAKIKERFGYSTYIPGYGDAVEMDGAGWTVKAAAVEPAPDAICDLEDYLAQIEAEYRSYRKKLIGVVTKNPQKLAEISDKLTTTMVYLKKMFKDV